MFETIMTISGKPGLYRMLSRGNNMFIVETIDATHKRIPVYNSDKIVLLDDIAIYTDTEEKVAERRVIQKKCLYKVDEIYWLLQRTVGLLWKDKLRSKVQTAEQDRLKNALNDFATRLSREEELLTGWRNGTQLIKKKDN